MRTTTCTCSEMNFLAVSAAPAGPPNPRVILITYQFAHTMSMAFEVLDLSRREGLKRLGRFLGTEGKKMRRMSILLGGAT